MARSLVIISRTCEGRIEGAALPGVIFGPNLEGRDDDDDACRISYELWAEKVSNEM